MRYHNTICSDHWLLLNFIATFLHSIIGSILLLSYRHFNDHVRFINNKIKIIYNFKAIYLVQNSHNLWSWCFSHEQIALSSNLHLLASNDKTKNVIYNEVLHKNTYCFLLHFLPLPCPTVKCEGWNIFFSHTK